MESNNVIFRVFLHRCGNSSRAFCDEYTFLSINEAQTEPANLFSTQYIEKAMTIIMKILSKQKAKILIEGSVHYLTGAF